MHSITVEFEEIPSVLIEGKEGGFVDGRCDIEFDRAGMFTVEAISIELFGGPGKRGLVPVSAFDNAQLFGHLSEMIEDRYAAKIADDIAEYFACEEDEIADQRREARRDDAMMRV